MRRLPRLIIGLLILALVGVLWYRLELRPVNASDQAGILVSIPTGSSVQGIGTILRSKSLIRSGPVFDLYARLHHLQGSLKAGTFYLRPSMSMPEIAQALVRGYSEAAVVTIPEGFTVKEIDGLLAGKGLVKSGELLACAQACDFSAFSFLPQRKERLALRGRSLEGYLFPDTYFVVHDTLTPRSFLERLLSTFQKRVVDGLKTDLAGSKHSLDQIVTMASLIEKETKTDVERPIVAGILWKRLDAKMGLGADASIRYAIGKPNDPLTESDLAIDSPYNLRKFRDFPPTPIGNPGLASIQAALHPNESPYFYYLHDSNGVIHYAMTNEEQNLNRAKYLR
ncbi:endolytic transglycosylase MltG [Candidatus Peregrinibacteria bacterium]|nr:endolytic transglycosylase MltG [Candidatus Peregrinibacteria bacterium]